MAAPKIEADYDLLDQVSQRFAQQGDAIAQMLQNVRSKMDQLNGEWIGEGSASFFNEMSDLVLPGVDRLQQALENANNVTKQIGQVMKSAEEEASNTFQLIA